MTYEKTNAAFIDYLSNNVNLEQFSVIKQIVERNSKSNAIYQPLAILSSDYTVTSLNVRLRSGEEIDCNVIDVVNVLRGLNDNHLVKYEYDNKIVGINVRFDSTETGSTFSEDTGMTTIDIPYSIKIVVLEELEEENLESEA